MLNRFFKISVCLLLIACGNQSNDTTSSHQANPKYQAELKELSPSEYPDNPDVLLNHPLCDSNMMERIELQSLGDGFFHLTITPSKPDDDTIKLKNVDLLEFIPTVPKHIRQDEYLSKICLLNQEWNRNQVAFDQKAIGSNYALGDISISRIDLARNCLNSYLWELIFYTVDNGKKQVLYHGWFDFPKDLYASLFEGRNIIPFENCRAYMEQWQHPGSEKIELSLMRDIKEEQEIPFRVLNDVMYPLQGERKKKEREIISPLNYTSMQDFLTDSTTFATFTPPGFYNRADPRKTELSRFKVLNKVIKRTTINQPTKQEMMELEFQFDDGSGKMTKFLIGGINPHEFPVLEIEDCNKGQMYSMGIANHPFYETYGDHEKNRIEASTYFSFLLDKDNKWLDSHTVGIDGPLFHKDAEGKLHLWMLSFERHALVSHFELDT